MPAKFGTPIPVCVIEVSSAEVWETWRGNYKSPSPTPEPLGGDHRPPVCIGILLELPHEGVRDISLGREGALAGALLVLMALFKAEADDAPARLP